MLVLYGAEDKVTPAPNVLSLKDELGDQVRLVEITGAGHCMQSERPREVAAAILGRASRTMEVVRRHACAETATGAQDRLAFRRIGPRGVTVPAHRFCTSEPAASGSAMPGSRGRLPGRAGHGTVGAGSGQLTSTGNAGARSEAVVRSTAELGRRALPWNDREGFRVT
jgi:hypothetical protein